MDNNNTLITHYGYVALVIGSMAEGKTVTLLGVAARTSGLLKFPLVARPSRWEWGCGGRSATLPVRTMLWREDPASFPSRVIIRRFVAQCEMIQRHPYSLVSARVLHVRLPGGWVRC